MQIYQIHLAQYWQCLPALALKVSGWIILCPTWRCQEPDTSAPPLNYGPSIFSHIKNGPTLAWFRHNGQILD